MDFRKGQRRLTPEINLIAFIDVLLVILIFLMVSTTFSKTASLKVSLPTADANASAIPKSLAVAIDAQGRYAVQQQRVSAADPASLATVLRGAAGGNPDVTIEIHADAMASHQSVVQVMEAARIAGLPRLVFAAQPTSAR